MIMAVAAQITTLTSRFYKRVTGHLRIFASDCFGTAIAVFVTQMQKQFSMIGTIAGLLFASCAMLQVGIAEAAETVPTPAAAVSSPHTFGVGHKIGNGLGFLGLDVVFGLGEHLSLGLQANYLSSQDDVDGTITGYGLVPFAQYRFLKPGSSPYVSAGPLYLKLVLDDVSASAPGVVGNLGWEWIWKFGLSLNIGAGVAHLGTVTATDGFRSIEQKGGTFFNIESALRYYFL